MKTDRINPKLIIREEAPQDREAIRLTNRLAFAGEDEAALVDRLRDSGAAALSLVAVLDGSVVGHILFSNLVIETALGAVGALSLAPMAVKPELQRQGIGSALVLRGLERCREQGHSIVVVLGHPGYYPRFGFSAKLAENLHGPYSGKAWMALELKESPLNGVRGTVRYPEAFAGLGQ